MVGISASESLNLKNCWIESYHINAIGRAVLTSTNPLPERSDHVHTAAIACNDAEYVALHMKHGILLKFSSQLKHLAAIDTRNSKRFFAMLPIG
jgi:hypothetical protein